MSQDSSVTYFRWEIKQFRKLWTGTHVEEEDLCSKAFPLNSRPWFHFSLFCNRLSKENLRENSYGITMKNLEDSNRSVEVKFDVWFENNKPCMDSEDENQLSDHFTKSGVHVFNHSSQFLEWSPYWQDEEDFFDKIYENNMKLFLCCNIFDFHASNGPSPEFCQNQMSLFNEGVFDAKIFVGKHKKEFKILKAFFMAQSPVFKAMFHSDNFNESKTNEATIEDVDEKTMLALIKWLYMSRIEKDVLIEDLFKVADKYQIYILKFKCVEQMISTLDVKNVLPRLVLADFYSVDYLMAQIIEYMGKLEHEKLDEFLESQEWIDFKAEKPEIAAKFVSFTGVGQ